MTFLGVENVYDTRAIIGKDGMADGFQLYYKENGKEKRKVVYIREYKGESDGRLHGFGNGVMYKNSCSSSKKKRSSKVNLKYIESLLKS